MLHKFILFQIEQLLFPKIALNSLSYSYVWWNSSFEILNVSNEQKLKHLCYFLNINFATDVNFCATFFIFLFLF